MTNNNNGCDPNKCKYFIDFMKIIKYMDDDNVSNSFGIDQIYQHIQKYHHHHVNRYVTENRIECNQNDNCQTVMHQPSRDQFIEMYHYQIFHCNNKETQNETEQPLSLQITPLTNVDQDQRLSPHIYHYNKQQDQKNNSYPTLISFHELPSIPSNDEEEEDEDFDGDDEDSSYGFGSMYDTEEDDYDYIDQHHTTDHEKIELFMCGYGRYSLFIPQQFPNDILYLIQKWLHPDFKWHLGLIDWRLYSVATRKEVRRIYGCDKDRCKDIICSINYGVTQCINTKQVCIIISVIHKNQKCFLCFCFISQCIVRWISIYY